jgi:hypothetical protein
MKHIERVSAIQQIFYTFQRFGNEAQKAENWFPETFALKEI